jgi:hypothetical protein
MRGSQFPAPREDKPKSHTEEQLPEVYKQTPSLAGRNCKKSWLTCNTWQEEILDSFGESGNF